MTVLQALGASLVPVALGAGLAAAYAPRGLPPGARMLFGLVGVGFGFAASAAGHWLTVAAASGGFAATVAVDLALVAGVIAVVAYRRRRCLPRWGAHPRPRIGGRVVLLAWGVLVIVLAGLAAALGLAFLTPHGQWDAWGFWNARARFLYHGDGAWLRAFSDAMPHPDYPLLWPLTQARVWAWLGSDTTWAPRVSSLVACTAALSVPWLALAWRRGLVWASVGTLLLASWPYFFVHGAWQYADLPLAFFVTASLVLMSEASRPGAPVGLWGWAGAAAGCAAWTKNEGLLFCALFIVMTAVRVGSRRDGRALRAVGAAAVGAAPGLALVALHRLTLAASTGLLARSSIESIGTDLVAPARHATVLAEVGAYWFAVEWIGGAFPWLARPAGALWLAFAGIALAAPASRSAPRRLEAGLVLGLMVLGYYTVYVITPAEQGWHIGTSLRRLTLHLWPAGVWLVMAGMPRPDALARLTR